MQREGVAEVAHVSHLEHQLQHKHSLRLGQVQG